MPGRSRRRSTIRAKRSSPSRPGNAGAQHVSGGNDGESSTHSSPRTPSGARRLLDDRTVVVAATPENRAPRSMVLDHHPVLDTLHPGSARAAPGRTDLPRRALFGGLRARHPVHLRPAERGGGCSGRAATPAFARYLRLRARDLLADDYEGGDAAWVTGDFTGNLNAQIGSYETYDDALYGVKTFFSLSLLVRDRRAARSCRRRWRTSRWSRTRCPTTHHKRSARATFRSASTTSSPISARRAATNTATILPNEAYLARQYGRTILMRGNILLEP